MTRYEMIKTSSLEDIAGCLCWFFSSCSGGCKDCPASTKCYVNNNGMKEFLLEEVEE